MYNLELLIIIVKIMKHIRAILIILLIGTSCLPAFSAETANKPAPILLNFHAGPELKRGDVVKALRTLGLSPEAMVSLGHFERNSPGEIFKFVNANEMFHASLRDYKPAQAEKVLWIDSSILTDGETHYGMRKGFFHKEPAMIFARADDSGNVQVHPKKGLAAAITRRLWLPKRSAFAKLDAMATELHGKWFHSRVFIDNLWRPGQPFRTEAEQGFENLHARLTRAFDGAYGPLSERTAKNYSPE